MCQLCCNPAGEKSCCCFSLSIALLVIAGYYGVIGGIDIFQAEQFHPRAETQFVGGIVNCAIGGYVCLCVLLGFLKLGLLAYLTTFLAFLVTLANGIFRLVGLIVDWVHWGKELKNGSMEFQWAMVTSTLSQLLTICVILGFANLFWSAACVFRAGGNGCEYKSYKQLEAEGGSQNKKRDEEESEQV